MTIVGTAVGALVLAVYIGYVGDPSQPPTTIYIDWRASDPVHAEDRLGNALDFRISATSSSREIVSVRCHDHPLGLLGRIFGQHRAVHEFYIASGESLRDSGIELTEYTSMSAERAREQEAIDAAMEKLRAAK